jgi:glycerol-3-phosphate dehydrogenase subunit B
MLERAGVAVLTGTARLSSRAGRRVERIEVHDRGDALELEAKSIVLATGKFVGGGIGANGRLREIVLDCPVWIEHAGDIFEQAEPLALTNADRREEQPLLAAGVMVDAEDRPVNLKGEPVFENVWAAGAVRRGYDSASQGLGHAAAQGWAAGERAAS